LQFVKHMPYERCCLEKPVLFPVMRYPFVQVLFWTTKKIADIFQKLGAAL